VNWPGESWRRMKTLFQHDQFDREMDEEMRLHRDLRRAEVEGGTVRSGFGNGLKLREESREMWGWKWLDDFVQDVRFGARTLKKSPSFTIVTAFGNLRCARIASGVGP